MKKTPTASAHKVAAATGFIQRQPPSQPAKNFQTVLSFKKRPTIQCVSFGDLKDNGQGAMVDPTGKIVGAVNYNTGTLVIF